MKKLKTFTCDDIRRWGSYYEPSRHLSEGVRYTAIDVLNNDSIPFEDRLWVIMREELVSMKLARLFAVRSSRQVQHLMTDARSINALDVMDRFIRGLATSAELSAARSAARSAAWSAGWSAAESAAESAAWSAAWSAAESAAWSAARSAAESAARSAAWSAAESAQKTNLLELLIAGIESGDTMLELDQMVSHMPEWF